MRFSSKKMSNNEFKVEIFCKVPTTHKIFITEKTYQELTQGKITKNELLNQSIIFLLDKEPNTSILPEFDLLLIQSYFSDYKKFIQTLCKSDKFF